MYIYKQQQKAICHTAQHTPFNHKQSRRVNIEQLSHARARSLALRDDRNGHGVVIKIVFVFLCKILLGTDDWYKRSSFVTPVSIIGSFRIRSSNSVSTFDACACCVFLYSPRGRVDWSIRC